MAPTDPTSPERKRRWPPSPAALTGVVLVILVICGLLQRGGPSNEQQQTQRDAVSACWNEARTNNGSAMEQRNKITQCELMESDFRKKSQPNP